MGSEWCNLTDALESQPKIIGKCPNCGNIIDDSVWEDHHLVYNVLSDKKKTIVEIHCYWDKTQRKLEVLNLS